MSQLSDLESAIRASLSAIELEGTAVFADVAGFGGAFGRSAGEFLRRLRKPAAVVGYVQQRGRDGQGWAVVIADQGLRGAGEARLGSDDVIGIFELVGLVRSALDGGVLSSGDRLRLVEERLLEADDRAVICQQLYLADRSAGQPKFDGQAICGTASEVSVTVGSVDKQAVEFAFPGIDGVYRHELGLRGRQIVWAGQLRAAGDEALNTIERDLESYVSGAGAYDLEDGGGRTFEHCVLERFERTAARQIDPATSWVAQAFKLVFKQLDVT